LVCLSALLLPNSYIILFLEFYFLPFSVRAPTNIICLTLLSWNILQSKWLINEQRKAHVSKSCIFLCCYWVDNIV
jgi:hypothetical protein